MVQGAVTRAMLRRRTAEAARAAVDILLGHMRRETSLSLWEAALTEAQRRLERCEGVQGRLCYINVV